MTKTARDHDFLDNLDLIRSDPGYYATSAWVVAVSDGDTVHAVLEGATEPVKVRLGGIDAPEMDQEYGPESKALLERLALGKQLNLHVICTGSNLDCPGGDACTCTDIYGRLVGVLSEGSWRQSINKRLVEAGLAYDWPRYGLLEGCHNAQRRARSKRVGVWARFGGEVRPWSHRHGGELTPMEFMKTKGKGEEAEEVVA